MGEKVTFAAINAASGKGSGGEDSVDAVMGKKITVKNVELEMGRGGEPVLLITLVDGKQVRSGSKILKDQAANVIKPQTDAGKTVETTIEQKTSKKTGRTYYTFV
jgi:hypothetical protein